MSHKEPAYIIFDGDEDSWAYRFMRGWKASDKVDFDFRDAHDLDSMTSRAQDETYVKANLRKRMAQSSVVIVLVGEKTKNLYRFVRWELDLALELGLPLIVVNLNNHAGMDALRCPPILRDVCAVHLPFKLAAIKHALDNWPVEYGKLSREDRGKGHRLYPDALHKVWMQ